MIIIIALYTVYIIPCNYHLTPSLIYNKISSFIPTPTTRTRHAHHTYPQQSNQQAPLSSIPLQAGKETCFTPFYPSLYASASRYPEILLFFSISHTLYLCSSYIRYNLLSIESLFQLFATSHSILLAHLPSIFSLLLTFYFILFVSMTLLRIKPCGSITITIIIIILTTFTIISNIATATFDRGLPQPPSTNTACPSR